MRKVELLCLTGIRFYAALFVFLSHVIAIPGMEVMGGSYLIFNVGVVSVSFFFVLSGFILTYNYEDAFRGGVPVSGWKRFVWDRLARIYPVHLLAMVLIAPIAIFSPNLPLDWRAVPVHALLLQCWWPSTTPAFKEYLNVPSWALSCEWFFYCLAPVVIFFVCGNRHRWIPVAVLIVYTGVLDWFLSQHPSDSSRLYLVSWFAPSRLVEFVAGAYLARVFLTSRSLNLAKSSVILQGLGIVLIMAGAMYRQSAAWPFWGGLLYLPGSALLILGLAYGQGGLVAHLSRPFMARLGLASFAFYMIHAPLIRAVKGISLYLGWEVHSWPLFWGVAVTLFVLIQVAALGVLWAYEIPLQQRLRAFPRGAGMGV
jgi:peptidoglycan/LPS O-acetylase OafA/YrhL